MQEISVFPADLEEGIGESVQRLFALRLRRLDHQRLFYHQRKIYRRRVEAEIQQTFADVHGADLALAFQRPGAGDKLMHAALAVRYLVNALQTAEQVIGVEYGILTDFAQS